MKTWTLRFIAVISIIASAFTASADPVDYASFVRGSPVRLSPSGSDLFATIPGAHVTNSVNLLSMHQFGWNQISGDILINPSGIGTVSGIGGKSVSLGGPVTFNGAHSFVANIAADTNVSFPASGTLVTTSTTDPINTALNQLNFNVKSKCNAVGNGIADDAPAIQSCITQACAVSADNASGAVVYAPPGEYLISESLSIPCNGVTLQGAGNQATVFMTANPALDPWITIADQVSTKYNNGIRDVGFLSVGQTAGSVIYVNNINGVRLYDLEINGAFKGITIGPSASSQIMWLNNIWITRTQTNGIGIDIQGGNDHYLNNIVMTATNAPLAGIRITGSQATMISNSEIFEMGTGLLVQPSASTISWLNIINSEFDSGTGPGVSFIAGNGSLIQGTAMDMVWTGSNSIGVDLQTTGTGVIDGFGITNHRSLSNNAEGLLMTGTGVKNVSINGQFAGNSASAAGTYAGIHIGAGVSNWNVSNSISQQAAGRTNTQSYGVQIDSGASDYFSISNSNLQTNLTGDILDGSTGTHKVIQLNPGSTVAAGLPESAMVTPYVIGSPSLADTTTSNRFTHLGSSGTVTGAALTDNGDGTVNVASATATIRENISATITRSGSVATVTTASPHHYETGDQVLTNGANQTEYNQLINVTVTGPTTYTYPVTGTPATPATGTIYSTSEHANLYTVAVPAVTNLVLTDHQTNYIYVTYNFGTPVYQVTTDPTQIYGLSHSTSWIISREGTTLSAVDLRGGNLDIANKMQRYHVMTDGTTASKGGNTLTATGTRNIAVSAGSIFYGAEEIPHLAFDTSGSDTFTYAYQTSGTWTFVTGQTQISNTQYNNTATGLATLTTGNYGVHWVYIINNQPSRLLVVYGTGDYASQSAARAAQPPTTPSSYGALTTLVGRIIIQKSASTFLDTASAFALQFPITSLTLGGLANVSVPDSPNLNDRLVWNGSVWTNGAAATGSAGPGVTFYNETPIIIATGTNNSNQVATLGKAPVTTTEQTQATALATNTVLGTAWLYDTALGRTTIDAGTWNFNTFAGVDSVAGGRITTITRNVMQVIPAGAGTVTITGTGTTRTATVSGATPFVSGDASATNTSASYLQTPQGLYQITAYTSSTVVSIATPSTYANESGVTYQNWRRLFSATSGAVTAITPSYASNTFFSTQPAFTVAVTDKLGIITFGTSNNTTTLTTVYNGTTHNSSVASPLTTLHNELGGLQGGTSGQYYHLTSNEYAGTGVGTGNMARLNSPVFTTPNIGTATGSVSGNAGTATALATSRAIYGNNFDGTAALTGIIASTYGGTGNGFTKFTGPTTSEKTFTLPNASDTLMGLATTDSISGVKTFADGKLALSGATSGTATLKAPAVAGTNTYNLPATAGTLGYLEVLQNSQSANYTTVMADSGKQIFHPSTDANARTFTIDSNANVAYPVGTVITFINMSSSVVSIAITTDTMYLAGSGTTGTRSLAQYGVATAVKIDSTHWVISGSGLT